MSHAGHHSCQASHVDRVIFKGTPWNLWSLVDGGDEQARSGRLPDIPSICPTQAVAWETKGHTEVHRALRQPLPPPPVIRWWLWVIHSFLPSDKASGHEGEVAKFSYHLRSQKPSLLSTVSQLTSLSGSTYEGSAFGRERAWLCQHHRKGGRRELTQGRPVRKEQECVRRFSHLSCSISLPLNNFMCYTSWQTLKGGLFSDV